MKHLLVTLTLLGAILVNAVPLNDYKALQESEELEDDLENFLSLIPLNEIRDAEDEGVVEASEYILSDELQNLVIEIESIPELKKILNHLQKAGLDAYGFVNKTNSQLGIARIATHDASSGRKNQISGGLSGLIRDIKALFPTNDIEKRTLIRRIKSQEFQGLVDEFFANTRVQQLLQEAKAKGVDVQVIFDAVSSFFGMASPPRPVRLEEEEVIDIFKQIWAKVPLNNISDVIVDYLIDDQEFKDLVKYMLSDEFKNTQVDIEKLPEMKALLKYLESVGMHAYEWVNAFHELIGLPPIEKFKSSRKITGGVRGLIKDIRSILPLDQLYEFYYEKLKSSNKFKEFIERLETNELQNFVNALGKHEGFGKWLKKLQAKGVDFDEVLEILQAIIGIKFPPPPPPLFLPL